MKLHWSPSAPFVRKVMIVAHANGLADRIETMRSPVGPARLSAEVMATNPLNKVLALVTDDGRFLFDSRVICEYLDALGGAGLVPVDLDRRWRALTWQALADGMVDAMILRRDEFQRGEGHRSSAHEIAFETKMERALDRMEEEATLLGEGPLDIGKIAVGVALAYLDFRPIGTPWRESRPALAAWEAGFAKLPSVAAAPFHDEGPPKQFPFYKIG